MFANVRLLCYVVTMSSIILVSRVQFAQAQAKCHVGKLGPMLKTNVTLELCTFDNRTSSSTSSCSKPQSGECLRGEHTLLNFIYKRHNTSLYRRLSAMSYGGEICFAYDTYYDDNYDTPYDTSDPFLGCRSKCVDVAATNTPWLISATSTTCTELNRLRSCRGFIEYAKVTISKGIFDTRTTSQHCIPRRDKSGIRNRNK